MRFSPLMPFFATLFMAAAFFYFQYAFAKMRVVDFSEFVFYGQESIFSPTEAEYIILLYNSKNSKFENLAKTIPNENGAKILAIDLHQNTNQVGDEAILPLSAGMNTLLRFARYFKIDAIPAYFHIKQNKKGKYAQDSKITAIEMKQTTTQKQTKDKK